MRILPRAVAVVLVLSIGCYAEGNTWNKIRYNGGSLQSKVDPKDWGNNLTVTPDIITLKLKDGQTITIPAKKVKGLSYGQEASRRVGRMVALGILLTPIALFGLFGKKRDHFIGVEYTGEDGKDGALLLQAHKDNYRAVLTALKGTTGAPLSVGEKDKEHIPAGLSADVVAEGDENKQQPTATVLVSCNVEGAEVFVDEGFVGNAPATLKLPAGKHTVRVAAKGHQEWTREIVTTAGSELKMTANLEKPATSE